MRLTHARDRRGFSLVEVIVALALAQILLVGALSVLWGAARHAREAAVLQAALWEGAALADSLAAGAAEGERARGWGTLTAAGGAVVARDSAGSELVRLVVPGSPP